MRIAFANEVALICEDLGADVFEVRRIMNTCPVRDTHIPGFGVDGYCLPKDPWLPLSSAKNAKEEAILVARRVNEHMPVYMVELARETLKDMDLKGRAKIAIMDLSFLQDFDDTRNSPSLVIIDMLADEHDLITHDPLFQKPYKMELTRDLDAVLKGADCVVFVTDHSCYRQLDWNEIKELIRIPSIVDGRNIFDNATCEGLGFYC